MVLKNKQTSNIKSAQAHAIYDVRSYNKIVLLLALIWH